MKANISFPIDITGELTDRLIAAENEIAALDARLEALEGQPPGEPPPVEPPPDPEPGEVVFSCDWTEAQFAEWTCEPPFLTNARGVQVVPFQIGNTKTHGEQQTGPDGQTTSLRMRMGECRPDTRPKEGCFPVGQSATFRRTLDLPAGVYEVEAYKVGGRAGVFMLSVANHFSWTDWAPDGNEWYRKAQTFQHPGGLLVLVVYYRAPDDPTAMTGDKVTGLKVRRVVEL